MKTATQRTTWGYTHYNKETFLLTEGEKGTFAELHTYDLDKAEANAEFICKAVNEYDHLKEVNQELLKSLKEVSEWHQKYYEISFIDYEIINRIKEAIKLAESKDHV